MALALTTGSTLLLLLADATRVRLLALLEREELSVAEITRVTALAQSRVSTHLGKLREAGLVSARRDGASTYYRPSAAMGPEARALWSAVRAQLEDALLTADRARCEALVQEREGAWPDSVAGQMERHYSPGRTWEATARGLLGLTRFGDVLDAGSGDGTLAALIAPRARSVTCVDRSEKVLDAARVRLAEHDNVSFHHGDLTALPSEDASFDHAMLFNVLTYTKEPGRAIAEAARVLRPGGQLAIVTLAAHSHDTLTGGYGHVIAGFTPEALSSLIEEAGLTVATCAITSRERQKPYFDVLSAFADKP